MAEFTVIESAKNPAVTRAAELKEKKTRDARGAYLAEGKRILRDLIDPSGAEAIFIKDGNEELKSLACKFGCPKYLLSDRAFLKLSDTVSGEGIVAVLKKRKPTLKPSNRVLILDGVGDPGNVGTLLRSAAAFGFSSVVSYGAADFYNPKVVRGAMGAVERLNLFEMSFEELKSALEGYEIFAADLKGEELKEVASPERLALIVGNEARGISSEIVAIATKFVKIAMPGGMESLNAGVAGSIGMYYFM